MASLNISNRIREIEEQLAQLPTGAVVYKQINGKRQPYLQWAEGGKTKSKYLKALERETVIAQVEKRKALAEELKRLRMEEATQPAQSQEEPYRTRVIVGNEIERIIGGVLFFTLFSSMNVLIIVGAVYHHMGNPITSVSYSVKSTIEVISGLDDLSFISMLERLFSSCQFKSALVYFSLGVISCISADIVSAISSATFFVCPLAEKYATSLSVILSPLLYSITLYIIWMIYVL